MRKFLLLLVFGLLCHENSFSGTMFPEEYTDAYGYDKEYDENSITSNYGVEDREIMNINGDGILMSELLYYYDWSDLNNINSLNDYFPLFYAYKLKVADAKERELDKTFEFKEKMLSIKQSLVNKIVIDSLNNRIDKAGYPSLNNFSHSAPRIKMQMVTYRLSQKADAREERLANLAMDNIHEKLKQGFSFNEISETYSGNDNIVFSDYSHSGVLESFLLDEMNSAISRTRNGEVSAVFSSPEGLHVLRPMGTFSGLSDKEKYELMGKAMISGLYDKSVLNNIYSNIQTAIVSGSELKYKFMKLEDDLLVALWDELMILDSSEIPESDLREYFRKNKKDYSWEFPHFKGGVIHCKDKKSARKIKKLLKKFPMEQWNEVLSVMRNDNPEYEAEIETGLFRIGSNPYIDKLAFKCGSLPKHDNYAYTFILGKRLADGPDDYRDVAGKVVSDYKKDLEKVYFTGLEKKFHVEIHQDVLKTVNCSGNN